MGISVSTSKSLELPYRWNDVDGLVRLEMGTNEDPAAFGCEEVARGFPYCRATLEPAARGYGDMLGWIQLVDTDDRDPGFRVDHFEPLGRVPHPFAFFGFSPTMFDAPHTYLPEWDFVAHTFLCGLGGKLLEMRQEVRAILGFSWGFSKRDGEISWFGPTTLMADDWNGHLGYLRQEFGAWGEFPPGFFDHPLP
jgi:hypothetical protein